MVRNQTTVIGPNSVETAPVPRYWKAKSTTMMTSVRGIT